MSKFACGMYSVRGSVFRKKRFIALQSTLYTVKLNKETQNKNERWEVNRLHVFEIKEKQVPVFVGMVGESSQ